jgi:hypothetical protein
MRHLAPCLASFFLILPAAAFAQPVEPAPEPAQEQVPTPETDPTTVEVDPSQETSPMPAPPPTDDGAWARSLPMDTEVPPELTNADDEPAIGEGFRLFLQVQVNSRVGDLADDGGPTGMMFDFEGASLGGVPDALVGLRIGRATVALGITWSQVSSTMPAFDPCGIDTMPRQLDVTNTLFGLIPTVRFDALHTRDGRGRMEFGANIPLLISSRSREMFDMCESPFTETPDVITDTASDGIYGFGAVMSGRYHIFSALTIGTELGFTYLVFDFDDNPETPMDEPSVTTLGFHTGLSLSIEVPL